MAKVSVYFSIGSNLGDRRSNLQRAVSMLEEGLGRKASALSSIIETEPWGFESPNGFLNACVRFRIPRKGPAGEHCLEILTLCKTIERSLGREDAVLPGEKPLTEGEGKREYKDRPIDIDILFYGLETIKNEYLTVPHPLMSQRPFVMDPLREIVRSRIRRAFPEIFCAG